MTGSRRSLASPRPKVNPYAELGVERGVARDELVRAYRRLALQRHPDRLSGDTSSFVRLKQAFDQLSSAQLREDESSRAASGVIVEPSSLDFGIQFPGAATYRAAVLVRHGAGADHPTMPTVHGRFWRLVDVAPIFDGRQAVLVFRAASEEIGHHADRATVRIGRAVTAVDLSMSVVPPVGTSTSEPARR